jgi:hypothetical protein
MRPPGRPRQRSQSPKNPAEGETKQTPTREPPHNKIPTSAEPGHQNFCNKQLRAFLVFAVLFTPSLVIGRHLKVSFMLMIERRGPSTATAAQTAYSWVQAKQIVEVLRRIGASKSRRRFAIQLWSGGDFPHVVLLLGRAWSSGAGVTGVTGVTV